MEAPATFLGRMPRVYRNYRDACQLSLVRGVLFQLVESPIGKPCSLSAPGLNPFANAGKFFYGNGRLGAFSRLYNGFRDAVVDVFLVAGLLTRYLPEFTLGGLRTFALKVAASMGKDTPFCFDFSATINRAVGIHSKVHNAEVNSQNVVNADSLRVRYVANAGDVKDAAYQHQIHFALAVLKQPSLPNATLEGDRLTPVERPYRYGVVGFEAKDAVVVGLGGVRAEGPPGILVKLVAIRDLRYAAYNHLSREIELLAATFVGNAVQFELSKRLGFPRPLGQPVTRMVGRLKRCLEAIVLFFSWKEFDICYELHFSSIEEKYRKYKGLKRRKPLISQA